MHFKQINRIVELAHVFKLNSMKDLIDQTHWDLAAEYGAEVITLVKECVPKPALPSPFTTTPLVPRNDHQTATSSSRRLGLVTTNNSRPRVPPTCSVCRKTSCCSEFFCASTFCFSLTMNSGQKIATYVVTSCHEYDDQILWWVTYINYYMISRSSISSSTIVFSSDSSPNRPS